MVKVKNLEKKDKTNAEFDKKTPANRVKSINDDKLKKKSKQKNKLPSAAGGAVEKEVKPIVKEVKKEIAKALKAKENLKNPKPAKKAGDKAKDQKDSTTEKTPVEVPVKLATRDHLKKAVKSAKDGLQKEKEAGNTKNLFDDEVRIGLQVIATKIPQVPAHVKKILLEHSLFGDDQPDICFIIRDAKIKKSETAGDEAVMAFEAMLKENGVTGIKTVMTLSKLKSDYGPHSMKLKLLNTYDVFLVEAEISEHTYSLLGKHFIQKRKRPLQIDTTKKETMKLSIENAIRKVSFKLNSKSNFSIFEVGTLKMENNKIVDNIENALEQLKEKWPGGWKNILRLYLKPMKQSKVSIPIYYSSINPNDVEVPVEVGSKQSRVDKLTEQLAKASKKFRLDKKTKKMTFIKNVKTEKVTRKDKKRKLNEGKEEVKDEPAEGKKKKKKTSVSETAAEAPKKEVKEEVKEEPTEGKKKKKNAKAEVVAAVEAPKKADKKKKSAPEPEIAPVEASKKADKKKKKAPVVEVTEEPAVSTKKKTKKNKA